MATTTYDLKKPYKDWSEAEKKAFFKEKYKKEQLSLSQLAELTDTYVNKMRRDLTKLGFEIRSKSAAAKVAVKKGRMVSPTKGKKLSTETKNKIGKARSDAWYDLDESEKKRISEDSKKRFENWEGREEFLAAGARAINKASVEGSKLERHLKEKIEDAGYKVECHAEQLVGSEDMHIDLYVPEALLAIEVDGPSHFQPIYGEEKLLRSKQADAKKNAKILGAGFRLIRVKQTKNLTTRSKNYLADELLSVLDSDEKYLEIGDENV